ncbi:Ribosome associated membrane domain-containing protein, putative [Eimeria praecox]|uniref:Ribosome associated membrane domain-containing protein, putative n=1 Tax=Eimeria praecox TaxID=51316 RepID=U6GZQ7_9EIME|nr:Ribosome associated membrane domain-containing protein, putative [Eimeria praecox]
MKNMDGIEWPAAGNIPYLFRHFVNTLQRLQPSGKMAGTNRKYSKKIEAFDRSITKRGHVSESKNKKGKGYPVGPIVLAVFLFVVVGSAVIQIISTAQRGAPLP